MANLALCARMAHQGGLVGNIREFRNPQGKRIWAAFSGNSFGLQQKSYSPAGRDPQLCQRRNQQKTAKNKKKELHPPPHRNEKLSIADYFPIK